MRHGAGVEMIASEGHRPRQLSITHHLVHFKAELGSLAVAEPRDPRRQPLERHVGPRELDPVRHNVVVAEAHQ